MGRKKGTLSDAEIICVLIGVSVGSALYVQEEILSVITRRDLVQS
jgi:hypothetical protein